MINKNIIIIVLMLTIGFLFLYIDQYKRLKSQVGEKEVIYRYVPRTPYDELQQELFPSDIFETMFSQPSPWINSVNDLDARKSKEINKYFVSQI
jgi:hypothetical protein